MILDLARFVETERCPYWTALEKTLDWLDREPARAIPIQDLERFHFLVSTPLADLMKIAYVGVRRRAWAQVS